MEPCMSYNKPLIDQACSVDMARYCSWLYFFCMSMGSTHKRQVTMMLRADVTEIRNNEDQQQESKPNSFYWLASPKISAESEEHTSK